MVPKDLEYTDEDRRAIRRALADLDPREAEIDRNLTMAERFAKGCAPLQHLLDAAREPGT